MHGGEIRVTAFTTASLLPPAKEAAKLADALARRLRLNPWALILEVRTDDWFLG
jgi:hypothetical protein